MVQPDMGIIPTYIDVDKEINFRKLKKTISVDGEWVEKVFYEVKPYKYETADWCFKYHGYQQYQGNWWATSTSIVMEEKVYVHWKLCE